MTSRHFPSADRLGRQHPNDVRRAVRIQGGPDHHVLFSRPCIGHYITIIPALFVRDAQSPFFPFPAQKGQICILGIC
ncbi:hypothetical protein SUBVAR_04309 [Subdoligranulum variabile DSM 15176]|uniref:Uncharacterized protein n=1 Tax=Subdoligranulum variabile DSM 15176 TaxID=411471 RepID=D1PIZ1_9FIRM|nr:hypothetical protein SUBVAR_04309 [Subdoligranulum variabile DSM 15176]